MFSVSPVILLCWSQPRLHFSHPGLRWRRRRSERPETTWQSVCSSGLEPVRPHELFDMQIIFLFRPCFENYSKNVVNVKFLLTISYQVLFPSSWQTRLANMITICLCFHRRIVECIVCIVPFIFSAKEIYLFFHGCLDPSWKYFINVCILNICWCFTCWTVLFCFVRQQGRR